MYPLKLVLISTKNRRAPHYLHAPPVFPFVNIFVGLYTEWYSSEFRNWSLGWIKSYAGGLRVLLSGTGICDWVRVPVGSRTGGSSGELFLQRSFFNMRDSTQLFHSHYLPVTPVMGLPACQAARQSQWLAIKGSKGLIYLLFVLIWFVGLRSMSWWLKASAILDADNTMSVGKGTERNLYISHTDPVRALLLWSITRVVCLELRQIDPRVYFL